jgi:hypothetical protein
MPPPPPPPSSPPFTWSVSPPIFSFKEESNASSVGRGDRTRGPTEEKPPRQKKDAPEEEDGGGGGALGGGRRHLTWRRTAADGGFRAADGIRRKRTRQTAKKTRRDASLRYISIRGTIRPRPMDREETMDLHIPPPFSSCPTKVVVVTSSSFSPRAISFRETLR